MTSSTRKKIDEEKVAMLLKTRYLGQKAKECPETELMAQALSPKASSEIKKKAKEHLSQCPECAETILVLQEILAEAKIPSVKTKKPIGWIASLASLFDTKKPARFVLWPALATVLVVALVVWWRFSSSTGFGPKPGELVIKGSADDVFVAVRRGSSDFPYSPNTSLLSGDTLGFFYSAEQKGYLAIFDVEADGGITLLVPANQNHSMELNPGYKQPLADSARFETGRGCEWLLAVFSDAPLELGKLRKQISLAEKDLDNCSLRVQLPNTRTIKVIPIRR